jgi:toxin-antitoxin system PIN domain toxin
LSRGPEQAHLLDGNVLVALVTDTHVHHAAAQRWFAAHDQPFATCPITQGTLIRLLMNLGDLRAEQATQVLGGLTEHLRHRFWPDSIGYGDVTWAGVMGHRQVTDAYLAALARHHRGRLVTFDGGLASLHGDVAVALSIEG